MRSQHLVAEAQSDEIDKDYSQWELPKEAKARLGKGGINVIQFSPDGTQLAVGSNIGVWLYDVETGEEKSLFKGACRSLTFSPDGRFLANGGGYSDVPKVQLWEIATGREVLLADAYDTASALRFSSDGKMLVSVSGSGMQLSVWMLKVEGQLQGLSRVTPLACLSREMKPMQSHVVRSRLGREMERFSCGT